MALILHCDLDGQRHDLSETVQAKLGYVPLDSYDIAKAGLNRKSTFQGTFPLAASTRCEEVEIGPAE